MNISHTETLWYVTVLSNFARGYDKYARTYSKANIRESTFANRFFLLRENDLHIGINKANSLLVKLALPGNRLLALRTKISTSMLRMNTHNGLGQFTESDTVVVEGIAFIEGDAIGGKLIPVMFEEAIALSMQLLNAELWDYVELQPRTFSVLPVARGCQASCPFCFSEASISVEQKQSRLSFSYVAQLAILARARGAERFVITGGGEPGILPHAQLCALISAGSAALGKAVLISNGHHLSRLQPDMLTAAFADYSSVGLNVLTISRHHHDDKRSESMMGLHTDVVAIAHGWRARRERWPDLKMRLICVLQLGGVDSLAVLEDYVTWAVGLGVSEVCFKELYVSTSVESFYYRHAANEWSAANQVSLRLVLEFSTRYGFVEMANLPWGSPIFCGEWRGKHIQIAAYTEPSLFWERTHGIARSWNLMADGRCFASLEDRASEIKLPIYV